MPANTLYCFIVLIPINFLTLNSQSNGNNYHDFSFCYCKVLSSLILSSVGCKISFSTGFLGAPLDTLSKSLIPSSPKSLLLSSWERRGPSLTENKVDLDLNLNLFWECESGRLPCPFNFKAKCLGFQNDYRNSVRSTKQYNVLDTHLFLVRFVILPPCPFD